jgi:hypothetical protein
LRAKEGLRAKRGHGEPKSVKFMCQRSRSALIVEFDFWAVLRKRRELLSESTELSSNCCRNVTMRRVLTEAVPLRKKPFAIGSRDSQDRLTVAA